MGATPTRREALRAAALGAGTLAGAGLLRPVSALAQASSDEDLRDFLAPAIALEQIAVFAYDRALDATGVSAEQRGVFEHFRDQEQAHANALRQALDSLGFDLPDVPSSPDDADAFDVDGISDDRAQQLTGKLAKVGQLKTTSEFLDYLTELEQEEIGVYAAGAPGLDSTDLATTSAEIAANQAQHLVVLGDARKQDPAQILDSIASAAKPASQGSQS